MGFNATKSTPLCYDKDTYAVRMKKKIQIHEHK